MSLDKKHNAVYETKKYLKDFENAAKKVKDLVSRSSMKIFSSRFKPKNNNVKGGKKKVQTAR